MEATALDGIRTALEQASDEALQGNAQNARGILSDALMKVLAPQMDQLAKVHAEIIESSNVSSKRSAREVAKRTVASIKAMGSGPAIKTGREHVDRAMADARRMVRSGKPDQAQEIIEVALFDALGSQRATIEASLQENLDKWNASVQQELDETAVRLLPHLHDRKAVDEAAAVVCEKIRGKLNSEISRLEKVRDEPR